MHASFPPFTRKFSPAPDYRAPAAISDTESKLRTLKHYLYHAGLLLDEVLAADSHVAPNAIPPGMVAFSPMDGGACEVGDGIPVVIEGRTVVNLVLSNAAEALASVGNVGQTIRDHFYRINVPETVLPLRRDSDGSLATDGTAAGFSLDRDATGA